LLLFCRGVENKEGLPTGNVNALHATEQQFFFKKKRTDGLLVLCFISKLIATLVNA
jgi:hypothetical protein